MGIVVGDNLTQGRVPFKALCAIGEAPEIGIEALFVIS